MRTVSGYTASEYWDAIRQGNPTHAKMVFNYVGAPTLTDEDFDLSSGITVEDIINPDTDLVFGRAVMKQVTAGILVNDKTRSLQWEKPFQLFFGVEMEGVTKWCEIGLFYGKKPTRIDTQQAVEFIAYDGMSKFNKMAKGFFNSMTFSPAKKLSEICQRLCNYVGVTPPSTFPPDAIWDKKYGTKPCDDDSYTCRDLLALIAEVAGRYAKVEGNTLKLVWYEDHTEDITISESDQFAMEHEDISGYTWDMFDELTWDEADQMTWDEVGGYGFVYGISLMRVKQSRMSIELDYPEYNNPPIENVYLIAENPFFQISDPVADREYYIKPLYYRMNTFGGQLPMKAECVGNWLLESGDIVKIITGDWTINMPVFRKTMTWRGSVIDEIEVTGTRDRKPILPTAQGQIYNNNLIRIYVDDLRSEISGEYYQRKSGIEITTDGVAISGNKYVTIEAEDNKRWIFDDYGLRYRSIDPAITHLQFSSTYRRDTFGEAGICGLKNSSNDKHGRIAFWTTDQTTSIWSACLVFDCDETNGGKLYPYPGLTPYNTMRISLGNNSLENSAGWFWRGYIEYLYSLSIQAERINGKITSDGISIHPMGANERDIKITENDNRTIFRIIPYNGDNFGRIIIYNGEFGTPSSRQVKHNIKSLENFGEKIDKLNPVSFVYNNVKDNKTHLGLIYEDTVDVIPEICNEENHKGKTMYSINYPELIPILLKEIQDLRKRVAELERRCVE